MFKYADDTYIGISASNANSRSAESVIYCSLRGHKQHIELGEVSARSYL